MEPIFAALLGYALGSIPFGLLLTRMAGAGDIRAIGSGNIGATNVLRTGRKGLAAATLLLDAGKGVAAVLIAREFWPGSEIFAAAGAFLGHCYPVWLRFNGGKGVATFIGVCFGLHWPLGVIFLLVWISVALVPRLSSLGGLCGALSAPLAAWLFGHHAYVPVLGGLFLVTAWRHRANIQRLLAGTEPRIGAAKG